MDSTIVEYSGYVSRETVPKCSFFTEVVPHLGERRFKTLARMSFHNFDKILTSIQQDDVFRGKNSSKQLPIYKQLLIVLYRLGSTDAYYKISFLFGVGDGGSIDKITKRVFGAILRKKDVYLNWPTAEERALICQDTMHELPFCIGYVDGSEVKLAEKPLHDSESYFSRKHIYSLKVQAVCDYKLKIRHLVCGYPGSVHDARIYNNCELATNSEGYFSGSQWLAGDSAYKLTQTVITPYRATSKVGTVQERNTFNYHFGKYRIRVENIFGLLKERFASLKELRVRIGTPYSVNLSNVWIFVCAIIHNMIDQGDMDFDLQLAENEVVEPETSGGLPSMEGETKRRAIFDLLRQNL